MSHSLSGPLKPGLVPPQTHPDTAVLSVALLVLMLQTGPAHSSYCVHFKHSATLPSRLGRTVLLMTK